MWATVIAVVLFSFVYRTSTQEALTSSTTRTTIRIHGDRGAFQRMCSYSGTIPPFRLQWIRNGSVIQQEEEGVLTSTLMISPVEYQHRGIYGCRVINGRNIWLDASVGSLKVFYADDVFESPQLQRVGEGSDIRLICKSKIPTTYVYWTIPSGSSASVSGYIRNAQESDEGIYGCHIIDRRGSLLHTIEIRLIVNLPGFCDHPMIENGDVSLSNGSQEFSTAVYSCDEFFYLSGPSTRTCTTQNTWSGIEPQCRPVTCPALAIHHGQVELSNGTSGGSVATYICDQYFNLSGINTRTCQPDQIWTDEQPTCEPVVCPTLDISHGTIYFTNRTYGGSLATFKCDPAYVLNVTNPIKCMENGTWNGTSPGCYEILCPLYNISNGQMTLTNGYGAGGHARFSCETERGFSLIGEQQLLCQYDGRWSGPIPFCSAQTCTSPPNVPNTRSQFFQETFAGNTVQLECPLPYIMTGDPVYTCLTNGTWMGNLSCELQINCPPLPPLWNGDVKITVYGGHVSAIYSCNEYYVVRGKSHRLCSDHNIWTGEAPVCYRVDATCMPPAVENGRAVVENVRGRNRKATYECLSGYVLTGPTVRYCQTVMGQWSGEEPLCELSCDEPVSIDNGYSIRREHTITYYCNTGYHLDGRGMRVCDDSLTWTGAAPTCVADTAPAV